MQMNIAERNFEKHGHTSFDVWLPAGSTLCAAFREEATIRVGFLQKQNWKQIEWNPRKGDYLLDPLIFMPIYDVRIVKSGWFALATVDFVVPMEQIWRGKTDKAFAEFLASIVPQIDQAGRLPH